MLSKRISIIVPAFNEQNAITTLLKKIADLKFEQSLEKEIIIVDDGSWDTTAEKIENFVHSHPKEKICFLRHSENRGKGAAVRTGLETATGDVVIIQDADLEYDPEDILQVIDPIMKGKAEIVYGSRILYDQSMGRPGVMGWFTGKHPRSNLMAYLGGVTITRLTNVLTGARLTDEPTCYKCFLHSVISKIVIECDDFSWEPEVTMKLLRQGYHISEVPIRYYPRSREEGKKIRWFHGVKALSTLILYRFCKIEAHVILSVDGDSPNNILGADGNDYVT